MLGTLKGPIEPPAITKKKRFDWEGFVLFGCHLSMHASYIEIAYKAPLYPGGAIGTYLTLPLRLVSALCF